MRSEHSLLGLRVGKASQVTGTAVELQFEEHLHPHFEGFSGASDLSRVRMTAPKVEQESLLWVVFAKESSTVSNHTSHSTS